MNTLAKDYVDLLVLINIKKMTVLYRCKVNLAVIGRVSID